MNRLGIRLQLLSAAVLVLLLVAAGSVLLTHRSPHSKAPGFSPLLAGLHKKGDLKRKERHAAVLAAKTGLPPVPDCDRVPCIALTFDDGPNPLTTPQIVAILEAEHVPATFFMVGSRVAGNEALLQRIHADGDEIGNHSWSHPDLTKLPPDQVHQQIVGTQQAIKAAGVPAPKLFRPPYGAVNQTVSDAAKPLTLALWNEDPKDWAAHTPQQVLASGEAAAQPGGVIDMHDIYHVTANALQPLIVNLKGRGFHFVTMSQLMGAQPANGEFYGYAAP